MNHFSKQDIKIIIAEAHQNKGYKLFETSYDLIARIIKKKLSLHKIPFSDSDVKDFQHNVCEKLIEKKYKRIRIFNSEKSSFKRWLILITNNTVIDELKKKNEPLRISGYTQRGQLIEELIDNNVDEDIVINKLDRIQLIDIIEYYVKTFSAVQQTIFKLKYYDGHSISTIAMVMRKTENNISVILHRLITKLKTILDKNKSDLFAK